MAGSGVYVYRETQKRSFVRNEGILEVDDRPMCLVGERYIGTLLEPDFIASVVTLTMPG